MNEIAMKKFKGIIIRKIAPVDPNDLRGPTFEWCKGQPGLQISVFERKAGVSFGGHYHKGEDKSKNPERFFLIKGKEKVIAENGLKNQKLDISIEGPTEIIISPNILHTFKAITDVIFLEYRETTFDKSKPDTYPADTYSEYIESLK